MHETYQTLYIGLPPDDKQLAYSKLVEVIVKNKTQKVHLVGSVTQFITMHDQYNIKCMYFTSGILLRHLI